MAPDEPVLSEHELQAYLDGELPRARMIEIEAYLSAHPQAAGAMMADMRSWNEVRLAFGGDDDTLPVSAMAQARRLERGLARQVWIRRLRRGSAVLSLVAAGWLAHAYLGPWVVSRVVAYGLPPAFVDDAVQAYEATRVRLAMVSQVETQELDEDEIRAVTQIVVPNLPADWAIRDVQVFPSRGGPGLQMAIDTPAFGLITLFAIRSKDAAVAEPAMVRRQDFTTAYWQTGYVNYALVAKVDTPQLDAAFGALIDPLVPQTHRGVVP